MVEKLPGDRWGSRKPLPVPYRNCDAPVGLPLAALVFDLGDVEQHKFPSHDYLCKRGTAQVGPRKILKGLSGNCARYRASIIGAAEIQYFRGEVVSRRALLEFDRACHGDRLDCVWAETVRELVVGRKTDKRQF